MFPFEGAMNNEQRLIELERRRRRAAQLLNLGVKQAEVARRVGVTRTSVSRWEKIRQEDGPEALRRPERFGRPWKLDDAQRAELIKIIKAGAMATGFTTELWTLPRIGKVVKERFGVELSQSSVWRMLQQRNEKVIRSWKVRRWPELKK
jgi:transposase